MLTLPMCYMLKCLDMQVRKSLHAYIFSCSHVWMLTCLSASIRIWLYDTISSLFDLYMFI